MFWLPKDVHERADVYRDGRFISDMVIPLTRRQAVARWRKFVSTETPLPRLPKDRATFTCRHWDENTRLCTVYEERPLMCRAYPYGGACSAGCSYQVPDGQ